jgi:hypothetical protein
MIAVRILSLALLVLLGIVRFNSFFAVSQSLQEQNEILFQQLQREHGLTDEQINEIRKIFAETQFHIGQGNPAIAKHLITPQGCQEKLSRLGIHYESARPGTWRPYMIRPRKNPKMRRRASISSSFRTFPARIPWFGCRLAQPQRFVGRWENAYATPTNGKEHAPGILSRQTIISNN